VGATFPDRGGAGNLFFGEKVAFYLLDERTVGSGGVVVPLFEIAGKREVLLGRRLV